MQRGTGLGERLANAQLDAVPHGPLVVVGMDTPQADDEILVATANALAGADAAIGPASDGGWWSLALRDASGMAALPRVPMSRADTYAATVRELARRGVDATALPVLTDVDTWPDAQDVARSCPVGRFGGAVADVESELLVPVSR